MHILNHAEMILQLEDHYAIHRMVSV